MEQDRDIAYFIVKRLIHDMLGRYKVDAAISAARDREEINVQVAMYEQWRAIVADELHSQGLAQAGYSPKTMKELQAMSLGEILELRENYLGA